MFFQRSSPNRFRRIPVHRLNQRHRPRGIAVVMVLGLLAVTLAISYATLRGQGTTSQLRATIAGRLDARVAAQSGLAAAIRKISENGWAGVNTAIGSNITNNSWYQVTFTTGDAKLGNSDPLYGEFPYRLTIDSVGYASDPLNAAIQSQHKSRCVVQLVRKKMIAEPTNWTTLTGSAVYQYDTSKDAYVQFPVRINNSATLMGKLQFCTEYPGNTTARDQYLGDLNLRRIAGLGDYRPFPTSLTIKGIATNQDTTTMVTMLTAKLATPPIEPLISATAPSFPSTITTYKLYPGGKDYTPPVLQLQYGNPLQNVTLAPDPASNPLGIFRCSGALNISNNVQITGTILTDNSGGSDISVTGTNVILKPFSLPTLYGSSTVYQLPATIAGNNLTVSGGADAQITGAALVWNSFELKNNNATATKFALTGNLITKELLLRGRSTWTQNSGQWNVDRLLFTANLVSAHPVLYFPDFEESAKGFTVKPTLTFSADSSGVKPHWHDWSQAVYQADSADPGLKWEVVRWEENL